MTMSDDNVIAKLKALAASWAVETNWPVTDNGGDFWAPTITLEGYRVSVYAGPFGGWDWEIMPGDGRAPPSSDWLTRDTAAEAKAAALEALIGLIRDELPSIAKAANDS